MSQRTKLVTKRVIRPQPPSTNTVWERMKRVYISQFQRSDSRPNKVIFD